LETATKLLHGKDLGYVYIFSHSLVCLRLSTELQKRCKQVKVVSLTSREAGFAKALTLSGKYKVSDNPV